MAATISWSSSASGDWSQALNWSTFEVPTAGDDVAIATGATVTISKSAAAADIALATGTPSNANLDVTGTLALGGTLSGGAVILSGTITGGTLEDTYLGQSGGTLQDVVLLGTVGDTITGTLAIDTLTAAALPAPVTVTGVLRLEAGSYDGFAATLEAGPAGGALLAAGTGEVTLGPQATLTLLDVAATGTAGGLPSGEHGVTLGGGMLDEGGIIGAAIDLTLPGFSNAGTILLGPVAVSESYRITQPPGKLLTWTENFGPTVDVGRNGFANSGSVALSGGTLLVQGGSFVNSGAIVLTDGTTEQLVGAGSQATVQPGTLSTEVLFESLAPLSIDNTGTIVADLIDFAASVSLGVLAGMQGALQFDGTLDLQGGTLDASAYGSVLIDGCVENGTLAAGSGTLALQGATLADVAIAPGGSVSIAGPIAIEGVPAGAGAITLDGMTTDLILTPGMTLSAVTVDAAGPATGTVDLAGGTVVLGTDAALFAAGSLLDLLGPGILEDDGSVSVLSGKLAATAAIGGSGGITLAAGTTLGESSALAGGLAVSVGSNAVLGAATVTDGVEVTVGAGATLDLGTLEGDAVVTLEAGARATIDALAGAPTIVFEGVALVTLPGTGALPVTLQNLGPGDLIDFSAVSSSFSTLFEEAGATTACGALDVTGASGDQAYVPITQPAAPYLTFGVTADSGGGTLVTAAACYRAGTRIATARGPVAVERLRRGDLVRTAAGRLAPVRWLGRRRIDCRRAARPQEVWPVRVAAHAIAPGRPARDLHLSPDHALFIDGALVPVRYLINGATIIQCPQAGIDYWHVELPAHDVLLAENLPTESYLDTGNRAAFEGAPRRAPPAPATALRIWRRRACAPLLAAGPRLAALHARLLARARRLGHALSAEPSLRVVRAKGGAVALVSRSFVPAHLAGPGADTRRLGVAVGAIRLDGRALPLDDKRLLAGWHAAEGGWRWTSGTAVIAAAGAREIAVEVAITGQYWNGG